MRLRLLTEDEFDFLDTDEPVQDGKDEFGDDSFTLFEFSESLNNYGFTGPAIPRVINGQIAYYIEDEDVSEDIRSHEYFVEDGMMRFVGFAGLQSPLIAIKTVLSDGNGYVMWGWPRKNKWTGCPNIPQNRVRRT